MPTSITVWGGVTIGPTGAKLAEILSYYPKPNEIYITSAYRTESNSHHSGLTYNGSPTAAIDIGFGGTGQPANGRDLAKWLYDNFWDLTVELIHSTPFNDDNGFYVKNQVRYPGGGPYAGNTAAQHRDHVHFATSDALADQILNKLRVNNAPAPEAPPLGQTPTTWAGTIHFADIASYQAGINVAALPAQGFNMVNIKTSEGTNYVFQDAPKYAREARNSGVDICAFHFLRAGSGFDQAKIMQRVITEMGGPTGMIIECDTEADASQQTIRDFITEMQNWVGRKVLVYTGDWWWVPRGYNVSDLTPYVTAAPNNGYLDSYPGDNSPHWRAGYGGWPVLSAMQYSVSPIAGVNYSGNISKSAIRDPEVYYALTGKKNLEEDMSVLVFSKGSIYVSNYVTRRGISTPEEVEELRRSGLQFVPNTDDINRYGVDIYTLVDKPADVDENALAEALKPFLENIDAPTVDDVKNAVKQALREGTE